MRLLPRLTIILLALCCTQLTSGQQSSAVRMGAPDDWTHHRLIFSNPGTAEAAMQRGDYFHWLKVVNDPRFILQQAKRSAAARSGMNLAKLFPAPPANIATPEPEALENVAPLSEENLPRGLSKAPATSPRPGLIGFGGGSPRPSPQPRKGGRAMHTDWSMNMGNNATSGLGVFPAKFSFDVNSANCSSAPSPDFVVYNTSVAGSASQASIVAYDNLYSGCTGTVPSTYWGYNTGGTIIHVSSPIVRRLASSLRAIQRRRRRQPRPAEMESEQRHRRRACNSHGSNRRKLSRLLRALLSHHRLQWRRKRLRLVSLRRLQLRLDLCRRRLRKAPQIHRRLHRDARRSHRQRLARHSQHIAAR